MKIPGGGRQTLLPREMAKEADPPDNPPVLSDEFTQTENPTVKRVEKKFPKPIDKPP